VLEPGRTIEHVDAVVFTGGSAFGLATADGIADRELIVCVITAVRNFEFDKPHSGGKLRIAYPFKFEARPAK